MSDGTVQVANLIARYAELIDSGDFDGVAELLGDAGVGAGDGSTLLTGGRPSPVCSPPPPGSIRTARPAPST